MKATTSVVLYVHNKRAKPDPDAYSVTSFSLRGNKEDPALVISSVLVPPGWSACNSSTRCNNEARCYGTSESLGSSPSSQKLNRVPCGVM